MAIDFVHVNHSFMFGVRSLTSRLFLNIQLNPYFGPPCAKSDVYLFFSCPTFPVSSLRKNRLFPLINISLPSGCTGIYTYQLWWSGKAHKTTWDCQLTFISSTLTDLAMEYCKSTEEYLSDLVYPMAGTSDCCNSPSIFILTMSMLDSKGWAWTNARIGMFYLWLSLTWTINVLTCSILRVCYLNTKSVKFSKDTSYLTPIDMHCW